MLMTGPLTGAAGQATRASTLDFKGMASGPFFHHIATPPGPSSAHPTTSFPRCNHPELCECVFACVVS